MSGRQNSEYETVVKTKTITELIFYGDCPVAKMRMMSGDSQLCDELDGHHSGSSGFFHCDAV